MWPQCWVTGPGSAQPHWHMSCFQFITMHISASKSSIRRFVITEKAVVAAFNQEKALVGAFSVITNLRMELFEALVASVLKSNVLIRRRRMVSLNITAATS